MATSQLPGTDDSVNVLGNIDTIQDFGGSDTYQISPALSGDVVIVDQNPSTIILPAGMTIDAARFTANGAQFEINGFTLELQGDVENFTFVFGGDPLNPATGTGLSFADTAAAFGTTIPTTGVSEGTVSGDILADGTVDGSGIGPVDPGTPGTPGDTFVLTEAVDNLSPTSPQAGNQTTAGDDIIIAGSGSAGGVHTLGSSDFIDGGDGIDRINIRLENNQLVPDMRNVEQIFAQALDTGNNDTISLINSTGVEQIWSNRSTNDLLVTNIQGPATVGIVEGNGSAFGLLFDMDLSGSADEVTIVTDNADLAQLTLEGDASGESFEILTFQNTGDSQIDLLADATPTQLTPSMITVTGDGTLDLDATTYAGLTSVMSTDVAVEVDTDNSSEVLGTDTTIMSTGGDDVVTVKAAAGEGTIAGDAAVTTIDLGDGDNFVDFDGNGGLQEAVITTGAGEDTIFASMDFSEIAGSMMDITSGAGDDAISIDLEEETAVTVDAGAGNDIVTILPDESPLDNTDDRLSGGADFDIIAMSSSDANDIDGDTDAQDILSDFEALRITNNLNAGTLDIKNFGSDVNELQLNGDVIGAETVEGFTSGATIEYRNDDSMSGTLQVVMDGATAANTPNDVLNVNLNADLDNDDNNDGTAGDNDANAVNLSVDGINILNVNATDRVTPTTGADSQADDGYVLNLSDEENVSSIEINGDRALTYVATVEATALNSVDGSASEGDLSIDLTAFSGTEGVDISGGAGDDLLVGTGLSDAIIGGDGDDQIIGDPGLQVLEPGIPQVSVFTIANAEAGDVFSIGSTDVTWTGIEATDNAAVANALAVEIIGESGIAIDAAGDSTGGTWTVTGPSDGSAMAVPALDTTNLPAAGDELTITLTGATFGTGELINYTVNGGGIVSVNVSGLSLAAATTAVVNSLNAQLGLTATSTVAGTISVVGPAGAGNNVTIDMMVADDPTDDPTGATPDEEIDPEAPAVPEVWTITPVDLEATETLSVTIGATSYSIVAGGTLATDLAAFVTAHETAINAQTGGVLAATATTLTITNAAGDDLTGGTITGSIIGGDGGTVTVVETDGTPEVPGIDNFAEVTADATDESAAAGTDNQTLTVATTAGTPEVVVGGLDSDDLTGGDGDDTFVFFFGSSTEAAMDTIFDFQAGDGSVDTDTLDLGSTFIRADVLLANQIDVAANSVDATAGTDIGAIVEDGIISLVGADAAEIDTLAEWIDVAEQVLAPFEVAAFEFDGSTYVVEEGVNIIELAGTVGIVGVSTTEDTDVIHIV